MLWQWLVTTYGAAEFGVGGEGRADVIVLPKRQIKRRPAWRGGLPVAGHHLPRFHASGVATFSPLASGRVLAGQIVGGALLIEPSLDGAAAVGLLAGGVAEIESAHDGLLDVMPEEVLLLLAA